MEEIRCAFPLCASQNCRRWKPCVQTHHIKIVKQFIASDPRPRGPSCQRINQSCIVRFMQNSVFQCPSLSSHLWQAHTLLAFYFGSCLFCHYNELDFDYLASSWRERKNIDSDKRRKQVSQYCAIKFSFQGQKWEAKEKAVGQGKELDLFISTHLGFLRVLLLCLSVCLSVCLSLSLSLFLSHSLSVSRGQNLRCIKQLFFFHII